MTPISTRGEKKLSHCLLLAVGILLWCFAARAAPPVVLTFEGLADMEPIDNYYNGGFGGLGSGPGPDYGVTFTYSQALISLANGGSGDFANNPSAFTVGFIPPSAPGGSDTMNVSGGFTSGFSLYYATADPGTAVVYSGLNGSGSILAILDLSPTPLGVYPATYNTWEPIGATFAGTAESVVLSDTDNYLGFDNITLGSATPELVPENTCFTAECLGAAFLLIAGWRLRRSAACP
jgi:hypothetical protein